MAYDSRHWRAFEARELQKSLRGAEPTPIEALVEELAARDPEIYDLVRSVKRKFQQKLREIIAETVDDPNGVDDVLAEVRRCLAR